MRDKYKNKPMREIYFFMLGDYKTKLHAFFVSNTFISNTRLRIDSK